MNFAICGSLEPTFPRIPWILESGRKILKPGQRILKHFEARPKDFKAFWSRLGFILLVFIYSLWFLLISLISLIPTHFLHLYYFSRVCREKIAPPLPKQVRFKNSNRTRKLENRIVSFFFKGCSESIFPSQ